MSAASSFVNGVDFVSVPCRDLGAAERFYGEVLGLEAGPRWQPPNGDALGAEFETGSLTLALIVPEMVGIDFQPNKVPIALHVDDFEAARAALEANGVEFKGEKIDSGVCHMLNFEDPEGNALMIHRRYAPRQPQAA